MEQADAVDPLSSPLRTEFDYADQIEVMELANPSGYHSSSRTPLVFNQLNMTHKGHPGEKFNWIAYPSQVINNKLTANSDWFHQSHCEKTENTKSYEGENSAPSLDDAGWDTLSEGSDEEQGKWTEEAHKSLKSRHFDMYKISRSQERYLRQLPSLKVSKGFSLKNILGRKLSKNKTKRKKPRRCRRLTRTLLEDGDIAVRKMKIPAPLPKGTAVMEMDTSDVEKEQDKRQPQDPFLDIEMIANQARFLSLDDRKRQQKRS